MLAVSGPILGRYTATIPAGKNAMPGKWYLTVDNNGLQLENPATGANFRPGTLVAFTGSELVLREDPGCTNQSGTPSKGEYRWALEGTNLGLTVVSDSCQDRIDTLTAAPWKRQS